MEKKVDRQISGILRDKTIDDKLMYSITNYDKQNYPFCVLKLSVEVLSNK